MKKQIVLPIHHWVSDSELFDPSAVEEYVYISVYFKQQIQKKDKLFKQLGTGTFYDHVHPKVGYVGKEKCIFVFSISFSYTHNVFWSECVCVCG